MFDGFDIINLNTLKLAIFMNLISIHIIKSNVHLIKFNHFNITIEDIYK